MEFKLPQGVLKSIGYCIYCGSTATPLGKEHIIPFGMGGRLVLPHASCQDCARLINRNETQVMQKLLGGWRSRMKYPLRKGRERDYNLEALIGNPLEPSVPISRRKIDADQFPRILSVPRYWPPKILVPDHPNRQQTWIQILDIADFEKLGTEPGKGVRAADVNRDTFCRMLAKMGHSFAHGMPIRFLSSFKLLLSEYILSSGADWPFNLIGGDLDNPPASDLLHDIGMWLARREGKEYLVVSPILFSGYGGPKYHVVVGERSISDADRLPIPWIPIPTIL